MTDHLLVCFFAILCFGTDAWGQLFIADDNNLPKSIPEDWDISMKSRFTELTAININVKTIKSNAFKGFDNLEVLELSGKIDTIEDDAFTALVNMNHLSLGGNGIQEIGLNVFSNLKRLEWSNISSNKIKQIRLNNLPMLEKLYLTHNEFTELSDSYFLNLPNLLLIDLSNNRIHTINYLTFSGCTKLTTLHLEYNQISNMDQFLLANLSELKEVRFDHNLITNLPAGFFNSTPKMETMDFGFNLLTEFHLDDNLANLTNLFLHFNELQSIGLTPTTQRNIKELDLSDNKLTDVGESLEHLFNLEILSLRNNSIKTFPLCIPGSLEHLVLSYNDLQGVALDNFCGSVTQGKLQRINLSSNRFTSFNLTNRNKSLEETQPLLEIVDLRRNFLSADIVNWTHLIILPHVVVLYLEPQRNLEVTATSNESKHGELDQNGDGRNHGNETAMEGASVEDTEQEKGITWPALFAAGAIVRKLEERALVVVPECSDVDSDESGKFVIRPDGIDVAFTAYCEMGVASTKWTVIQRRFNGSVDFHRDFQTYTDGFGEVSGEFWIGLERLHQLTKDKQHQLYIEITPFEGLKKFARFREFRIGSKDEGYQLLVSGYSGDAGDSLSRHNGKLFSTFDKEQDDSNGNCRCIDEYRTGWWFGNCEYSNLNAKYYSTSTKDYTSMHWETAYKQWSLKESRMMITKRQPGVLQPVVHT